MLPKVAVARYCCSEAINPDNYRQFVGDELIDEIRDLSRELKGLRVCQINATAAGGGVAELLSRQIPIYGALGITTDWRLIYGDKEFFTVTKGFHNALQGGELDLTEALREEYLEHNRASAEAATDNYDIYIVHDPQPAALRHFVGAGKGKWIWRCHIDSSQPDQQVWEFLRPYIEEYDAAVFTMKAFQPENLGLSDVSFIPPAIDPLSTKNMELPEDVYRRALAELGVNLNAPLLLQVSRFDPWKDPLGVIRAYQMVKSELPEVQLAMVGAMASDDPQGYEILETINAEALNDPNLYVFTNLTGVGNMEVNCFQRGATVVIQKSLREGFGLVVAEALWKSKPMVAGNAGGIPMQFPAGYEDYLIESVEDCADKLLFLLANPTVASGFGRAGKAKVTTEFLMPRLIRDELRLMRGVLHKGGE